MAIKFEAATGNGADVVGGRATVLHTHAEMRAFAGAARNVN
jgi:hypothetical protein